jgi:hypothetical protein
MQEPETQEVKTQEPKAESHFIVYNTDGTSSAELDALIEQEPDPERQKSLAFLTQGRCYVDFSFGEKDCVIKSSKPADWEIKGSKFCHNVQALQQGIEKMKSEIPRLTAEQEAKIRVGPTGYIHHFPTSETQHWVWGVDQLGRVCAQLGEQFLFQRYQAGNMLYIKDTTGWAVVEAEQLELLIQQYSGRV